MSKAIETKRNSTVASEVLATNDKRKPAKKTKSGKKPGSVIATGKPKPDRSSKKGDVIAVMKRAFAPQSRHSNCAQDP